MQTTIGLFFTLGSSICILSFRSIFGTLLLSPVVFAGLFLAARGWRQRSIQHLLKVLRRAESDLRCNDLGLESE